MSNVVDLQKYRVIKEARKIFAGYAARLKLMSKAERDMEIVRARIELSRFPNHALTKVKVEIVERITGEKICVR